MKIFLQSLAWFLTLSGIVPAIAATYAPEVGSRHVDFVLPRIDDRRPVRLSDLRGKKVLLIQFASW